MKNPRNKAWCCFGIMMLGVIIGLSALFFLNQKVVFTVICVISIAVFITGIILHYVLVRCPHCKAYLGRVYGPRCPFCGKRYDDQTGHE